MAIVQIASDLEPLIPTFLEKRKEDLVVLLKSVSDKNFEEVRNAGHKIKGASASYGFRDLSEIGKRIEFAARDEDFKSAKAAIEDLEAYMNELIVEFA